VYEVEQKFPVDSLAQVIEMLGSLGQEPGEERIEVDLYYNHPSRDFAVTDEAVRIRQVEGACKITYKGPKLDQTTKTRREIDLPLPEGPATFQKWDELLLALGFTPVGEVRKIRRKLWLDWQDRQVEISLDLVEPLGTFVELELVVESESEIEAAKSVLTELAKQLRLGESERRSYLGLILGGE
jgi:adenylate cyclase, class 2